MSLAYSYDGSFDGFLSAVFAAYARREEPEEITAEGKLQEAFGRKVSEIQTDEARARRVEAGMIKKMGVPSYQKLWTAFLSDEDRKATWLYRYARRGFEIGHAVYDNLAHPDVFPVEKLYLNVVRESHQMKEFARFSQTEGGVYYAKITPKNAVVPLIMPHFADRLSIQPFLIYDAAHNIAGVYNLENWYLVEPDQFSVPPPAEDELQYRRMWKNFYETIAIAERTNPVCRRTHMPMRFWCNMTEHGYVPAKKEGATGKTRNAALEPAKSAGTAFLSG